MSTLSTTVSAQATDEALRVLFIHHSTGANLLFEGQVRTLLADKNPQIQLWDHSYNLYPLLPLFLARYTHHKGLTDYKGKLTNTDYTIILSNNSPREYAEIFSLNPNEPPLKSILEYDVIIFKNCFPTTKITSDEQLNQDISYYTQIREALEKYPEKQFILFTPPPMRESGTTYENAQRAKKLVAWLSSDNFLKGKTTIRVFNFFDLLADDKGYLKKEYQRLLPWDSHPNQKANREIAPYFVDFLVRQK